MNRVEINRREFSGAFGDIGTDLPLLIAMIAAADLSAAAVFVTFGLAQIVTGFLYGLPMPMQPLKAMAVIVIAGGAGASTLFGAGLAIAVVMLALSLSGALTVLARVIPRDVVRGIQLGLAISLATLALRNYIPREGPWGYALAGACFVAIVALRDNRRFPPALPVVVLGIVWAFAAGIDVAPITAGVGFALPEFLGVPSWKEIVTGFVVLALPQLPLSLSNSVIATHRTIGDLFPERRISVRKIGLTYSATNLLLPLFGGIPLCHGCGGLAGHHAMGGRTGGSVVIYGGMFLFVGLFLSAAAEDVVRLFPYPLLGAVLLFEAVKLGTLAQDSMSSTRSMGLVLLVALIAANVPQGYVVGMLLGCAIWYADRYFGRRREKDEASEA